ncbi:MAG: UDP-glucose 4-epimerase GalE [Fibrobacter sp.]|nr:UDP-glucose 4-epimerase GalE [Fibrobacter sp.]
MLVIGGAGYIGSHICKALHQKKHDILVFDDLSRGNKKLLRWGDFVQGSILCKDTLSSVMKEFNPDGIIHLAAYAYVGESTKNPLLYYNNNVVGSLRVLESMVESSVKNIIFSSSCATYGIPETLPIVESSKQNPVNPYGQTKLVIEGAIRDFAAAYGLEFIILRYFNAAGADPDGECGELHMPETHLIPLVINAAIDSSKEVKIFGNKYPTPDGTCIRDYVHVTDLADAHVAALEMLLANKIKNDFFNLGSEIGTSNLDVIKKVEKISGKKAAMQIVSARDGDPAVLIADIRKAKEHLHFNPKYSDIETIIKHAYAWQKENYC